MLFAAARRASHIDARLSKAAKAPSLKLSSLERLDDEIVRFKPRREREQLWSGVPKSAVSVVVSPSFTCCLSEV
jgi:hypothetical protein